MLLYRLICPKSSVALSPWNSMMAFSKAWLIILNTGMNFDWVLCKCFISANSFVCKNAGRVEGVAGTHLLIISVLRRTVFKVVSRLAVGLCSQINELISVLSEWFCHFIKGFQKKRNWLVLGFYTMETVLPGDTKFNLVWMGDLLFSFLISV